MRGRSTGLADRSGNPSRRGCPRSRSRSRPQGAATAADRPPGRRKGTPVSTTPHVYHIGAPGFCVSCRPGHVVHFIHARRGMERSTPLEVNVEVDARTGTVRLGARSRAAGLAQPRPSAARRSPPAQCGPGSVAPGVPPAADTGPGRRVVPVQLRPPAAVAALPGAAATPRDAVSVEHPGLGPIQVAWLLAVPDDVEVPGRREDFQPAVIPMTPDPREPCSLVSVAGGVAGGSSSGSPPRVRPEP